MNTFRIKLVLIALFISGVLFSCQKEEVSENDCIINMQNLSGTYKLTAVKYKLNSTGIEQDYLVFMEACEKDNLIILKANGTYENQDKGISCTPSQTHTGNWSVSANALTSDGIVDGTISAFDCKTLVYFILDVYTIGDKLECTMVKQ